MVDKQDAAKAFRQARALFDKVLFSASASTADKRRALRLRDELVADYVTTTLNSIERRNARFAEFIGFMEEAIAELKSVDEGLLGGFRDLVDSASRQL